MTRMTLSQVQHGRQDSPRRIVLYGVEGIGKSTFAANAPSPVFIGAEDGLDDIDAPKFPEPDTWDDVFAAIKELHGDHTYQTLALDTLDWLEPLCWKHVCDKAGKPNIEAFSYGKGYTAALDEWRRLLHALNALRRTREMTIVLIAHATMRRFKNPQGPDFDRYELKLHNKSAGLCKEWATEVLFAQYEQYAVKGEDDRVRGVSNGARLIHTERTAAYDAKNRLGLPPIITLAGAWNELLPVSVDQLRVQLENLRGALSEDTANQLPGLVERAGDDAAKWRQLVGWVQAKTHLSSQENQAA